MCEIYPCATGLTPQKPILKEKMSPERPHLNHSFLLMPTSSTLNQTSLAGYLHLGLQTLSTSLLVNPALCPWYRQRWLSPWGLHQIDLSVSISSGSSCTCAWKLRALKVQQQFTTIPLMETCPSCSPRLFWTQGEGWKTCSLHAPTPHEASTPHLCPGEILCPGLGCLWALSQCGSRHKEACPSESFPLSVSWYPGWKVLVAPLWCVLPPSILAFISHLRNSPFYLLFSQLLYFPDSDWWKQTL